MQKFVSKPVLAASLAAIVGVTGVSLSATEAAAHRAGKQVAQRHEAHSYHRHTRKGVVVEAPAAYVETGYRRHVVVDAPFTAVRVHRRGVWVRAPFVDLYVPR